MSNTHGDFIWYELMTTDLEAAEAFYGNLVGWNFAESPQAFADYKLFSAEGPPVGGCMRLTEKMLGDGAQPMWAGYVSVDDADAAVDAVAKAGGAVLMPPWDIPEVGRIAFVSDPQGAMFYVMRGLSDQPSESFAVTEPKTGHCAWNELNTSDPRHAERFYGEVFGWVKSESMDMGPAGVYDMYRNGADREFMLGGMMKKPDETLASLWTFYFRVASIDTAADYVNANGGTIVHGPMEIPGGEFVFNAIDPQGALFSLIGNR